MMVFSSSWISPPLGRGLVHVSARLCRRALPAALLALLLLCAQGVVAGYTFAQTIDPAVRAGVAAGMTRVILELRITPGFRPEGELSTPAAVQEQRQTIARTQDDILARLAGTSFSVSRKYEGLPLLALEIGPEALARLEAAGDLVARVLPDSPRYRQP
jgi:cytosine/adenosine deaminase-related metal-dependent hydrolase